MTKSFLPGNVLKFEFPSIMLPDSNTNEPLSHGSVTYRIKIKPNLSIGTQILNTASIFFDYNAGIVTNTTLNTIASSLSVKEEKAEITSVSIYPNPVSNLLNVNISLNKSENVKVEIFDYTGKIIYTKKVIINNGTNNYKLNVKDLNNGVYLVKITSQNLNYSERFIKIN